MANVTININTDNDAFRDIPGEETARLLNNLAQGFKNGSDAFFNTPQEIKIRDINGNVVGECKITE